MILIVLKFDNENFLLLINLWMFVELYHEIRIKTEGNTSVFVFKFPSFEKKKGTFFSLPSRDSHSRSVWG